jgi:hypothetical protein
MKQTKPVNSDYCSHAPIRTNDTQTHPDAPNALSVEGGRILFINENFELNGVLHQEKGLNEFSFETYSGST